MSNVLAAIPFYKNEIQLAKCKKALETQVGAKIGVRVYDDSVSSLGFTKNVNRGLKEAVAEKFDYVMAVNQDCYLKEDAVAVAVKFMDEHPKCAIAGFKQLKADEQDKIIHGGTKDCFPAGIHEMGSVTKGDCNKTKRVPWVNGACMIFRVSDLIEIGLLDENMKMFGSDADISYTARQRNKECWYIAEAECLHEWGMSKSMEGKQASQFNLDMLYFRDKWITGEQYKDLSQEYFKE